MVELNELFKDQTKCTLQIKAQYIARVYTRILCRSHVSKSTATYSANFSSVERIYTWVHQLHAMVTINSTLISMPYVCYNFEILWLIIVTYMYNKLN